MEPFPLISFERNAWVIKQRRISVQHLGQERVAHTASSLLENEVGPNGQNRRCLTAFLVNRQCPWRCVFCDLWKFAAPDDEFFIPITDQLISLIDKISNQGCDWIKIYNAGSFFDARAIPFSAHAEVAALCRPFERTIVECHPLLVGPAVLKFRDLVYPSRLEVAMGLETAHAETLARLNKGISPEDFTRASKLLLENGVDVRAFVLVRPPFLEPIQGLEWACRSIEFAFDAGGTVVSLIPTRMGNGALEALASAGQFIPPTLAELEAALMYGLNLRRGRVYADLWDLERFALSEPNFTNRLARLHEMNQLQKIVPLRTE